MEMAFKQLTIEFQEFPTFMDWLFLLIIHLRASVEKNNKII